MKYSALMSCVLGIHDIVSMGNTQTSKPLFGVRVREGEEKGEGEGKGKGLHDIVSMGNTDLKTTVCHLAYWNWEGEGRGTGIQIELKT